MKSPRTVLALVFASSVALVACDNTRQGAREDAAEARRDAAEATADAKQEAREEAADARGAAREAGRDASEAVGNAGDAMRAAAETIDVKAALMADDRVDSSRINVDTFHETKTVVLKGSVPSADQRDAAARIAEREAPAYRIDNQLVVAPRR